MTLVLILVAGCCFVVLLHLLARRELRPLAVLISGEVPGVAAWLPPALSARAAAARGTWALSDVGTGGMLSGHSGVVRTAEATVSVNLQPHPYLSTVSAAQPLRVWVDVSGSAPAGALGRLIFGPYPRRSAQVLRRGVQSSISDQVRAVGGHARPVRRISTTAFAFVGLVALVVALGVAVGPSVSRFAERTGGTPGGSTSAPASVQPSASVAAPSVTPPSVPPPAVVEVVGSLDSFATASASSTSADSFDGFKHRTTYQAKHMLDHDPTTTWRMDGDGTGATLTFTLDKTRRITTLGLINGYAKVDPKTGEDRYDQERRVTAVTWTVGGLNYEQTLTDGSRELQEIVIQPVRATSVTLTIDAVTEPGDKRFDRTPISDVVVANQ